MMPFLTGVELGLLALGIGLSLASSILLKPKSKSGLTDKEPTTLASRGAYLPLVIGRRMIGSLFGWAGDRSVKKESARGGKGGLGGGGEKTKIFYEAGWHQLCVGPAYALHKIKQDGKVIYDVAINSTTTPSGSVIDLGKEGTFTIYWGETNQPVNTFLGAVTRVGIASRWPKCCYIEWNKKRLGTSPRWPSLEYEIEVRPATTIGGTGAYMPLGANDGINPAHILLQILTAPYPDGIGRPAARFDLQSFAEFAAIAVAEGLSCSIVGKDGEEVDKLVAELMQDCGLFLPTVDGKIRVKPIRPPGLDQPILSDDVLLPPRNEIENLLREKSVDQMIFVYKDRSRNYRESTINDGDNAQSRSANSRKTRKLEIYSTCSPATAQKIGDRRAQEELAGAVRYRLFANRGSRSLWPGLVVMAHEIPVSLRLTSVKPDATSGRVEIEAIPDYYGELGTSSTTDNGTSGAGDSAAADNDPFVAPLAFPPWLPGQNNGQPPYVPVGIGVLRIRKHAQILGADVHASSDNVTYYQVGSEVGEHAGGELLDALPIGDWNVDQGPTFTIRGPDIGSVLDLSPSPADWRRGRQVAVIGGEIFFLKKITMVSPTVARLDGLLRARWGTAQANHAIGAWVVIADVTDVVRFLDPSFVPGEMVYFKTQPFAWSGAVSLASVTPVTLTVPLLIPFGAVNFRTDRIGGQSNVYNYYETRFYLRWRHKSAAFARTGAGMQGAGEAVVQGSPIMGTFTVEMTDIANVVKRTWTGLTTNQLEVDCLQLITDFDYDTPGTVRFRIKETLGAHESSWQTIDVRRLIA